MTVHTCPCCNATFRDNRGARLRVNNCSDWPGLVCPRGHKITKAIKRERRQHQIQARASVAGLTVEAYRAQRRAEYAAAERWGKSSLFVSSADAWAAGVLIGNSREKR